MSLDVAKLEKVRELAGGIVQARCPACAEGGHDRTGEHLRIYPDGRFGCCVHPKDGEHRKRIFALAGLRKPGTFTLRIKTPEALPPAQSVKAVLTPFDTGTFGTCEAESENGVRGVRSLTATLVEPNSRTSRTLISHTRAYAKVDECSSGIDTKDFLEKLKDSGSAVRSVLSAVEVLPPIAAGERLPFLTAGGDLSIPFDSPERYHWWRGGQSVAETLNEVKERMKYAVTV